MRLLSIASGSSGNCIYVGNDDHHILIDAGISGKRIEAGLNSIGLTTKDLDGIFVTHEHIDHIAGIGVLTRKADIPIYATNGTLQGIVNCKSVGNIDPDLLCPIHRNENVFIGDLLIEAMPISHDAQDPVCYRVGDGMKKVAVATDMGCFNNQIVAGLQGLDALLLEANHDVRMLQVGPYPYYLKQRILGDRGHLSNELAGQLLCQLLHDNLKHILLGHLSQENNLPDLAHEAVRLEITMADNPYQPSDFHIEVAKRNEPSTLIEV